MPTVLLAGTFWLAASGISAADELPAHRLEAPAPLAARPFQLPAAQTAKLTNGLDVLVVENHEVPMVYVNLIVRHGSASDPRGQEGLASVTLAMMDEGAGDRTAEDLSKAARKIGANLNTFSTTDYSGTVLQVVGRTLDAGLDLLADVTLRPTFPAADWGIMQRQRIQDLSAAQSDPNRVASRIFARLLHGDAYAGRLPSEAAYAALSPEQMHAWHGTHFRPEDGIILVGGDTTLEAVLPLLEARFGTWSVDTGAPSATDVDAALPEHPARTVYLHDIPGAAQSVVRMGSFVMDRNDPAADAFFLANRAFGGQFMSRLNLNLREDKGWTYGARSQISQSERPDLWSASSSVVTPSTAPAITEAFREFDGLTAGGTSSADEPFGPMDQVELDRMRDGLLYTWPLSFENPGYLLQKRMAIWRYDLPEDDLASYQDRMRNVELASALSAWSEHLSRDMLVISVVGDAAVVKPGLEALGLAVIMVDANGSSIDE
jgi:zinc protease